MSISANKNLKQREETARRKKPFSASPAKATLIYLEAAALCILFDRVYALFGHGVSSAAMTFMFLYPLLGGALPFGVCWAAKLHIARPVRCRRLLFNTYNSGVAALTVASALTGVFEIAGTSSPYTVWLTAAGAALCAFGAIGFLIGLLRRNPGQDRTGAAAQR